MSGSNQTEAKSGQENMLAWDKTWKLHNTPRWLKRAVTYVAKQKKKWHAYYSYIFAFFPEDLLDHYGTVKRDGIEVFITQPYGEHDEDVVRKFAEEHGLDVKIYSPGPWYSGTTCYEFTPKKVGGFYLWVG